MQQSDWYGHDTPQGWHDADDGNVYLPYGENGDGQGDAVQKSAQFDWRAAETGREHFSLRIRNSRTVSVRVVQRFSGLSGD